MFGWASKVRVKLIGMMMLLKLFMAQLVMDLVIELENL